MLSVVFDYPVNQVYCKVVASCKDVVNEEVFGLSLTFYNNEDEVMKVEYDKDLFEDLEGEALMMLADAYYNPELNLAH